MRCLGRSQCKTECEECKVGLVRREYLTAYALVGMEVGEEKVRAY